VLKFQQRLIPGGCSPTSCEATTRLSGRSLRTQPPRGVFHNQRHMSFNDVFDRFVEGDPETERLFASAYLAQIRSWPGATDSYLDWSVQGSRSRERRRALRTPSPSRPPPTEEADEAGCPATPGAGRSLPGESAISREEPVGCHAGAPFGRTTAASSGGSSPAAAAEEEEANYCFSWPSPAAASFGSDARAETSATRVQPWEAVSGDPPETVEDAADDIDDIVDVAGLPEPCLEVDIDDIADVAGVPDPGLEDDIDDVADVAGISDPGLMRGIDNVAHHAAGIPDPALVNDLDTLVDASSVPEPGRKPVVSAHALLSFPNIDEDAPLITRDVLPKPGAGAGRPPEAGEPIDDIAGVAGLASSRGPDTRPAVPPSQTIREVLQQRLAHGRADILEERLKECLARAQASAIEEADNYNEDVEESAMLAARDAKDEFYRATDCKLESMAHYAVEFAELEKGKGNRLFQKGQYWDAYAAFQRGIAVFEERFNEAHMLRGDARKLQVALFCNSAQALLKCPEVEGASTRMARAMAERALALEPGSVKAIFRRGCAHANDGALALAMDDFQHVLRLDPGNEAAQTELRKLADIDREQRRAVKDAMVMEVGETAKIKGNNFFRQGQRQAAREAYEVGLKAVEGIKPSALRGETRRLALALYCNAAHALLHGDRDPEWALIVDAHNLMNKALAIDAQCVKALFRRGLVYILTEDWDYAHDDFTEVVVLDPGNDSALVELARLEGARPAKRMTFRWLDLLEAAEAKKAEGNRLFQKGEYRAAKVAYQRGLDVFKNIDHDVLSERARKLKTNLHNNAAQAILKRDDTSRALHEGALAMADQALALEPENVKAHFRRGVAYVRAEGWDRAHSDFQEVLRLDPENDAARTEVEKVKASASKTVLAETTAASRRIAEGDSFFEKGSYDSASAAYQKALKRFDSMKDELLNEEATVVKVTLYCRLAQVMLKMKPVTRVKAKKSREMAEKAIALDPTRVEAFFTRGIACTKDEDWSAARADFEEALQLNPGYEVARQELRALCEKGT